MMHIEGEILYSSGDVSLKFKQQMHKLEQNWCLTNSVQALRTLICRKLPEHSKWEPNCPLKLISGVPLRAPAERILRAERKVKTVY